MVSMTGFGAELQGLASSEKELDLPKDVDVIGTGRILPVTENPRTDFIFLVDFVETWNMEVD